MPEVIEKVESERASDDGAASRATCHSCGTPLEARAGREFGCAVCLFRGALAVRPGAPESDEGPERFGAFEIVRREDGMRWELGRGAMGVTYRAIDTTLRRG